MPAVGGTGVGHHLLRRVVAAAPATRHPRRASARAGDDPDGLKRPVLYGDVETDGARRAAAVIARPI